MTDDKDRLERIEGKIDALISDVRSTLLLAHAVEDLRNRVIRLEHLADGEHAPNGAGE
jgi:hypothetical protein